MPPAPEHDRAVTSLVHRASRLAPGTRVRTASGPGAASARAIVLQAGAALAASIGVGRFVYTPILPLMRDQAGLTAGLAATLATANYVGYLVGALAGMLVPALVRSARTLRASLLALVASLALMPVAQAGPAWLALRLVAGVASALVFMIAVSAMLTRLRGQGDHLMGWGFGGVGVGIALSGLLVLVLRSVSDWQVAWLASSALALALSAGAWTLAPEPAPAADEAADRAHGRRRFSALLAAYSLEGVGYIIAGTFLVAAIQQGAGGGVGSAAWVVVGLAEVPSTAVWAWLASRGSRPLLLLAALLTQAVGIALPALLGGVAPAFVSAVLFGGTFIGIGAIAFAIGRHLRIPRAVAILTTGYSAGQILGPLVVTPLLRHGYQQALLIGAGVVLVAALAAAALRVRFPTQA
jgi:predicted MFS family arabinose efflux permease